MAPKRHNKNSAVERVADKFGGYGPFARLIGLAGPSAVSKWNLRGGGNIPSKYHGPIMALAKKRRVRIRLQDLINL